MTDAHGAHDTRRLHRHHTPERIRFGVSQHLQMSRSAPETVSPFGGLPYALARNFRRGWADPLSRAFGMGTQRQPGALGSFITQATPVTGQYLPSMQDLSRNIESGARSTYGGYQQAIDRFMGQLPGFQATAGQATGGGREALGYARTAAEEAFSPLQSRALFQEASRRALAPAREAAAARGMLEGGQAQAGEQSLLSDLAFQALQGDRAAQQEAIAGLGGAAGTLAALAGGEAGVAGMGPEAMGSLFSAYPQLAQLLQGARELPLGAAQNLLGFLASTQDPTMALLAKVLPTVGQTSKSFGGGGSVGFG
jgi:hypothetical protein